MRDAKSLNRKRRLLAVRALKALASQPDSAPRRAQQKFYTACGGSRPARLTVRNVETGERESLPWEVPFLRVGSSADCDLRLDDPRVSGRHAYLQMIEGRWRGFDLASRTGVTWPGGRAESARINEGEDCELGPFRLRFECDEFSTRQPADDSAAVGLDECSLPCVSLRFLNVRQASGNTRPWSLQQPVTLVGSSQLCKLRLEDDSISRVHCSLLRTPGGIWLLDLFGRGGVLLNGQPVDYARLRAGDELQLGRYHIAVQFEASSLHLDQPE